MRKHNNYKYDLISMLVLHCHCSSFLFNLLVLSSNSYKIILVLSEAKPIQPIIGGLPAVLEL